MEKVILKNEWVARALKNIWLFNGKIAADAFALRPRLHEDYVSVLRAGHGDFLQDLGTVSKNSVDCTYALLSTEEVEMLAAPEIYPNRVAYQAAAIDNKRMKSHAGIFVYVNGECLVGGQPLAKFVECGQAQSGALLLIQLKLAKLAEKNIKRILVSPFCSDQVSEPAPYRE